MINEELEYLTKIIYTFLPRVVDCEVDDPTNNVDNCMLIKIKVCF
jgi:hypothetical protein